MSHKTIKKNVHLSTFKIPKAAQATAIVADERSNDIHQEGKIWDLFAFFIFFVFVFSCALSQLYMRLGAFNYIDRIIYNSKFFFPSLLFYASHYTLGLRCWEDIQFFNLFISLCVLTSFHFCIFLSRSFLFSRCAQSSLNHTFSAVFALNRFFVIKNKNFWKRLGARARERAQFLIINKFINGYFHAMLYVYSEFLGI